MNTFETTLCQSMLQTFRTNKGYADKAIGQLTDKQLRVAIDPHTNSIAVIMKHVAGNLLSRWTEFLTTDGEKLNRHRDGEFVDTFSSRQEMIDLWEQGWSQLFREIESLSDQDLHRTVMVRGEPHSVPLAMSRSLAHTCYHVGQIVFLARHLADEHWNTITIPRGGSEQFNRETWGGGAAAQDADPPETQS